MAVSARQGAVAGSLPDRGVRVEKSTQRRLFGRELEIGLDQGFAVELGLLDFDAQVVVPAVRQRPEQAVDAAEEVVQVRQTGEQVWIVRVGLRPGEDGVHDVGALMQLGPGHELHLP